MRSEGKAVVKRPLSESGGFRFWPVTIAIFLIGFLFAFAFIFAVQTQRCISFGDYWLESNPGLYVTFAWIFSLLFLWNLFLFVALPSGKKKVNGKAAHFLANGITLLVIGYVMLRLYLFTIEYEAIYEFADAEWNVSEGYIGGPEDCKAAKPFLGRWSVNVLDGNETEFPYAEMSLGRDLTFRLRDFKQKVVHEGEWQPPGSDWPKFFFYYLSEDQVRIFEIEEFGHGKMVLEQDRAYVGDEEIKGPLIIELRRMPELDQPENALDINWDFVLDKARR